MLVWFYVLFRHVTADFLFWIRNSHGILSDSARHKGGNPTDLIIGLISLCAFKCLERIFYLLHRYQIGWLKFFSDKNKCICITTSLIVFRKISHDIFLTQMQHVLMFLMT